MSRSVKILIAESSDIVRSGIISILKGIRDFNIDLYEVKDPKQLTNSIGWDKPDILLLSPSFAGSSSLSQIKKSSEKFDLYVIALQSTIVDPALLAGYDDTVYLYDSSDSIKTKITSAAVRGKERDNRLETLSEREKEILVCIVKGMTNKQIAEKLFLSAHTVGTHRRNISSKLGIHSASGLTIYAIVNKLIEL